MQAYTTFKERGLAEYTCKRSRFVGVSAPVKTEEDIAGVLAEIGAAHRDANHRCYAYALRNGKQRYSDDGEPQGTAGIPILEVLKRENITDGIVVVTRYFGGTLLGAPGLVRAYSHTAKLAADSAGTVFMRPCAIVFITAPYTFYDKLCLLLQNSGAKILSSDFMEHVSVKAIIPIDSTEGIAGELAELTAGKARLEIIEEVFA